MSTGYHLRTEPPWEQRVSGSHLSYICTGYSCNQRVQHVLHLRNKQTRKHCHPCFFGPYMFICSHRGSVAQMEEQWTWVRIRPEPLKFFSRFNSVVIVVYLICLRMYSPMSKIRRYNSLLRLPLPIYGSLMRVDERSTRGTTDHFHLLRFRSGVNE